MSYVQRTGGVLHRSSVATADKVATPAAPTVADITTGGVLLAATAYKATVSAATQSGNTAAPAAATLTTASDASNTHGARVTVAQVAGAQFYDMFLSTDAAPKWVGRITEAQRAAGVAIRSVGGVGGDNTNAIALAIRTALAADAELNALFAVSGATSAVILTDRAKRANDATLNIAMRDGTAVGSVAVPTSVNTTPGVAPVLQVETATLAGTITGSGNATITVTANGMTNSPKAISVAVVDGDDASAIAGKIRVALAADVDVAAFFTVSGATTAVILTAKVKAANDATMNIAQIDGTSHGLTTAANSANTTAGAAAVAQVETATVAETVDGVLTAGNVAITVTAAGMTNSPKTIQVAAATNDNAAAVAGKVRTALAADTDVNGFFVVSGATTAVILTARTKIANDATMNIASADGTTVGVAAAPTSANTTAGVLGTLQVETATVAGAITGAGNATITVTANGMTNSPKAISVAVVNADDASAIATKVRAALTADVDVAAFFTVSGATDKAILTALIAAANDGTMNMASADGTSHGVTTAATSANTTAGVAGTAQVNTATVDAASLISTSGTVAVTVTSNKFAAPIPHVYQVTVTAVASQAGKVDIFVLGTGIVSSANPFAVSNAYIMPTPVACSGYSKAYVLVKVKPTFGTAVPTLSLVHFIQNQLSPADFHQFGAVNTPALETAVVQSIEQIYEVDVDGATGFAVVFESITNASADIYVELA